MKKLAEKWNKWIDKNYFVLKGSWELCFVESEQQVFARKTTKQIREQKIHFFLKKTVEIKKPVRMNTSTLFDETFAH